MLIGTGAVLMAAVLFFPVRVGAISAEKAILLDAATGRVLYEQKADDKSLIASTTKMMTALVVCEQCNVLDRVRIPKEAVGVGEMGIFQSQLPGLVVHQLRKAFHCAAAVNGQGRSRVVAAVEHQPVEQLLHRQNLSLL